MAKKQPRVAKCALAHYLQRRILQNNRTDRRVATETHIYTGIVARTIALDNRAHTILHVAHAYARMVRILAVFVVDHARARRFRRLDRSRDLDRIAVNDMLVIFLDGIRDRRGAVITVRAKITRARRAATVTTAKASGRSTRIRRNVFSFNP
mgnify:CR=1 FL=1